MLKACLLCTHAGLNLRNRVLGEVEKNSFIDLSGKGEHSGLLSWKTMHPNPGEFGQGFYNNGPRVGSLTKLRCIQMLSDCGAGEDSWESLGQQGGPSSPS